MIAPNAFVKRVNRNEHNGTVNDEWTDHRQVIHVCDPAPNQCKGLEDYGPVDWSEEILPKIWSHERFNPDTVRILGSVSSIGSIVRILE